MTSRSWVAAIHKMMLGCCVCGVVACDGNGDDQGPGRATGTGGAGGSTGIGGAGGSVTPNMCGVGLPLVVSDLQVQDTLAQDTANDGSLVYRGSIDQLGSVGVLIRGDVTSGPFTTYATSVEVQPETCIISFALTFGSDGITGSGTVMFKVYDPENEDIRDGWDAMGRSNTLSTEMTIL